MYSATLVFPHQLYKDHPAIAEGRTVFLVEEFLFFKHYPFHKQKLVLHRASMKAYATELTKKGLPVVYLEAAGEHSDVRKLGSYLTGQKMTEVHYAGLSDDWLQRRLLKILAANGIKPMVYETPNFITSQPDADAFFASKRGYLQTDFYIWQRKRFKILLQPDGQPLGGKWSYDEDNRSPFPKGETVPEICFPEQCAAVKEAIAYVEKNWPGNYGDVANFHYPVTHAQAEKWLDEFLKNRFEKFGVYEDAMVAKEHYLYHSVLTPMLNTGLLNPKQVVNAAIKTARANNIPLNSTEGFIRQIIGWREFIHAIYQREGRKQRTRNYWLFTRPVPHQFWTGETGILPLDAVIKKVLQTGYSHHIERLMVIGNFMLLCEFDPDEVYRWFMEMYIDAYDWVMVPNTYGMTQFSEGGVMMTKPYISGSNYLMKMGDWAKGPWQQTWDGLFWRFMHVHRQFFLQNPRLGMLVHSFDKMDAAKQQRHLANGEAFLKQLDEWSIQACGKSPGTA